MKIEKRKVTSAIAATLGLTAAFTLNACDDSTSASSDQGGDTVTPNPESSAQVEPGNSAVTEGPAISSQAENGPASSQVENTPSSSSEKIVDIPLSQEPVSSSVAEAISSLMESSSSVGAPTSSVNAAISVADNPTSSAAAPSSSDVKPTSSEVVPTSSETATSSSSYAQWGPIGGSSSSQNGWVKPNSSSVDYSEECPDNDPYCINYHFCRDNPSGCMAGSMVTTFERDDITG